MKPASLALLVIVVSGVALRVCGAVGAPLATDESFTWRVVRNNPWPQMLEQIAEDGHAHVYFLAIDTFCAGFGHSLVALRWFSVLAYSFAVIAHFKAVQKAATLQGVLATTNSGAKNSPHGNAHSMTLLLLGTLLAVDALQVEFAVRARMYATGMLLFSLSNWAYLSGLTSNNTYAVLAWVFWGIITGLALLTHHFLGFAAAGQLLFAAGFGLLNRRPFQLASITVGCLTAVAVYSPWLPVVRDQFAEVKEHFWIAPLTISGVVGLLSSWLSGLPSSDWRTGLAVGGNLLAIGCIVLGLRKFPVATSAFLCHAFVPWVLCIGVSLASERPMLQDRYLVFGQMSAFTAIALGWATIHSTAWRYAAGALLVGTHFLGGIAVEAPYRIEKDAFGLAVKSVLEHDDGDTSRTIFVAWPADVNRARYFLSQAGRDDFQVKLVSEPFRRGHVGHISALKPDEICWTPVDEIPGLANGAWVVSDEWGNSAVGKLGAVDVVHDHEIKVSDKMAVKVTLVRAKRDGPADDH